MSKRHSLRRLTEVRIAVIAALVPVLFRLKLSQVERLLELGRSSPQVAMDIAEAQSIGARVDATLRRGWPFVRKGCLPRGVTLYYLLRRGGLDVSLCFGMGRPDADLKGHCWLEFEGEPFLERADTRSRYSEIVRMPGIAARGRTLSVLSRG